MKILRAVILADTLLLAVLGLGLALFFRPPLSPLSPASELLQEAGLLRLLSMGLGGLALVLWGVSKSLLLSSDRRRLARWLSVANFLIAAMIVVLVLQSDPLASILGVLALLFLPVFCGLGLGLAWAGRRPLTPVETAAEVASLKVPDKIRMGVLRQIGEAAAQEERNRLARDLHDSIKQQLFSINVGAATAQERWERDPEGARRALADVRRSAREAMVEMQAMLHQLRPEALLSTAGLIEALREQCEALGYRTGTEVTLELGDALPDDRLPPGTPEALFRIAQEMLANVARHARARRARLWLARKDEEVVIGIEDDGQGFEPAEETSGMGLRNLSERAAALRGRLMLTSAPGSGTWMAVVIPLLPVPVPPQIPRVRLEIWEAVQVFAFSAVTLLLQSVPSLEPNFFFGPLIVVSVVLRELLFRRVARSHPEIDRYTRLNDTVLFCLFMGGFSRWRGQGPWDSLPVWGIILAFSIFSMVRLHRVTRIRAFWRWKESPLRLCMILLMETGILSRLGMAAFGPRRLALSANETVHLLLLGAGLLYVASRRPRLEAPP
jgi:signal transduction histidine kinase